MLERDFVDEVLLEYGLVKGLFGNSSEAGKRRVSQQVRITHDISDGLGRATAVALMTVAHQIELLFEHRMDIQLNREGIHDPAVRKERAKELYHAIVEEVRSEFSEGIESFHADRLCRPAWACSVCTCGLSDINAISGVCRACGTQLFVNSAGNALISNKIGFGE